MPIDVELCNKHKHMTNDDERIKNITQKGERADFGVSSFFTNLTKIAEWEG